MKKAITLCLCLPSMFAVAEEVGVPTPDLTPQWTSPDAWMRNTSSSPWWPEVRPEARPGSYWWWPGSAVTQTDLTWNLETYRAAGWGNMGVIGIYGVKGEESRSLPIFSSEWFTMFNHAVTEGKRLGMNIDLTPSSGWRIGGPHITKEHSERTFAVKDGKIAVKELSANVKRAGLGGAGMCINPYSPAAVKFHFNWLSDRFRDGKGLSPRAFYYDSFENTGNWAPELPERFKQWRGYDLNGHVPALGGKGEQEEVQRVLCDYRETLSDLLLECVRTIAQWGEARGSGLRMQAHGAPANLLDMYAAASIPETEVFGANKFDIPGLRRDPQWSLDQPHSELVNRFASSAAHVAGRNLVISESFTWLRNHFHTALSHIKPEADRLLLCGINNIYYHGTCYSPEKTEWPGWLFYAATQVNARNSIFRDIPALNAYLIRCQSILQQGKPHNDVLLYWPVYDLWMNGGSKEIRFTVHRSDWIEKTTCGEAGKWLMKQGYSFDFVSDAQLKQARREKGQLITEGGSAYRTVLVPAATCMKPETVRHLIELARSGADIVFWKNLPQRVPGWDKYKTREEELKALFGSLAFEKGIAKVGLGRILLGDDLDALMDETGIERESLVDHGLKFIRRKLPGEVIYFIANQSAKPVDYWATIAAPCKSAKSAVLMDPMTGAIGKAHTRYTKVGIIINLQLHPGETRILRALENSDASEPFWTRGRHTGESFAVTGPWELRFVEGGPVLPAPVTRETLGSWTELADPEAQRFAGAACYSTTFKLSEKGSDRWLLDLGDVRESARVRVNNQPAGVVVAHPFRLDITDCIKAGTNTLVIEVTNLSANRIRDLDCRKVNWKKFDEINIVDHNYKKLDASQWPLEPSGLLGPVTLIPLASNFQAPE